MYSGHPCEVTNGNTQPPTALDFIAGSAFAEGTQTESLTGESLYEAVLLPKSQRGRVCVQDTYLGVNLWKREGNGETPGRRKLCKKIL